MGKLELIKIAYKQLNSKKMKNIKKRLFEKITDNTHKEEFMYAFDKNFIVSFVDTCWQKKGN